MFFSFEVHANLFLLLEKSDQKSKARRSELIYVYKNVKMILLIACAL